MEFTPKSCLDLFTLMPLLFERLDNHCIFHLYIKILYYPLHVRSLPDLSKRTIHQIAEKGIVSLAHLSRPRTVGHARPRDAKKARITSIIKRHSSKPLVLLFSLL